MMNIGNKIRNMKVKQKLNLYRGVAIAIVIFMGIVAALLSMVMKSKVDEITDVWSPALDTVQQLDAVTSDYRMRQYGHVVATTPEEMQRYDAKLEDADRQIAELCDKFSKQITTETEKKLYENILTKWDNYKAQSEEIIVLSRKQETAKAGQLMVEDAFDTFQDFNVTFDELLAFEQGELNKAKNDITTIFISMLVVITLVVVFAIVVTSGLGRLIIKMIVEPVSQITEAAAGMRQGDMSKGAVITYESEDELGIVAKALREAMQILSDYIEEISANLREIAHGDLTKNSNDITDFLGDFASIKESFVYILKNINKTLSEIHETSDQVASSAGEIAKSSRSLSDGATDQASAIEELTATVATVAGLAEESAKNTQEAYDSIRSSADRAGHEKEKMEELTAEMKRIMEISKEIENIITAIEEIASQTNLLSLNASIEAARAGDAGRGFAVVADQIGKLAADSAQSAVNTRELIGKTLEEIEKGNEITASVSVAFANVIEEMMRFAESSQQTNENVKSQAQVLEQVEEGIDQISMVMQNTAAASEECTAISENLSEEAVRLDELVREFKLF